MRLLLFLQLANQETILYFEMQCFGQSMLLVDIVLPDSETICLSCNKPT